MSLKEKIKGLGTKTLAVIAALAVVVSAATVAYLSSVAPVTADVQSPFEIVYTKINGVALTTPSSSIDLGTQYGGNAFTVTAELRNRANRPLYAMTTVTCNSTSDTGVVEDITCANLGMTLDWPTNPGEPVDISGTCTPSTDGKAIEFTTQTGDVEFAAGSSNENTLSISIAETYVGQLSCDAQAFPAPI